MASQIKSPVVSLLIAAVAALLIVSCAPMAGQKSPLPTEMVEKIVVYKAARKMIVYGSNLPLRQFDVALGRGGLEPKERQGDGRVPEGTYHIAGRNPNSAFHLSLLISYPTPEQAMAARLRGIDPGGDIMIHGLPNGQGSLGAAHRRVDWTLGCIAVTNDEIEWLWDRVADGTPIEIHP
jgi:murein L,D-transpeptidase YafK